MSSKTPKRKLTDSERRAIVRHVDDILGIRSEDDDDQSEPPAADRSAAEFPNSISSLPTPVAVMSNDESSIPNAQ
jgi:hypothetical protein